MPKSRGPWIAIAVVACALVIAGFWFLLIGPNRADAAEKDASREKVAAENAVLASKVAALRADFARIENYRSELSLLRVHLPTEIGDEQVFDQLTEVIEKHEGTLLEQKAGAPVSLVGQIQAAAIASAEAEEGKKDGESAATDTATPAPPAGWAASTLDQLAAVPVELEIEGTFESVRAVFRELGHAPDRYLMVAAPQLDVMERETGDPLIRASFTLYTFTFTDAVETAEADVLERLDISENGLDMPSSSRDPFGLRDDE
ncbi:hypothetical protein [Sanguibacter massiliensis]|uniref:hypothetical protein n=1 Tax=Sanguibacter massiliensis TaxID=1973217 RepID=UPI00101AEC3E|nr:hypothetical protein [Sanguibacter massiliensis]